MAYSALTFNLWDIPFVRARHNYMRTYRLVRRINELKPDFVFLQEVFRLRTRIRLATRLDEYDKPENLYERRVPNVFFDATGGLVTLSRWPIVESEFQRFDTAGSGFDEWVSGKGYTTTTVITDDGPICLVNLHLANRPQDSDTRKRQIGQILGDIGDMSAIVLGGDFNMYKFDDSGNMTMEYEMIEDAGFIDSLVGEEDEFATFCKDDEYTHEDDVAQLGNRDRRLDYIFLGGRIRPTRSELVGVKKPISDHRGYMSTFELG